MAGINPNFQTPKDPVLKQLINKLNGLFRELFPVKPKYGGTGVTDDPKDNQILIGNVDHKYELKTLIAGSNITFTETDQTLEIASSGGAGYTDEQAQDAVGGILTDTASIDFTYNDGANTITAAVLPGGVDHNSLANLTVGDPHTQYRLESADHNHQSTGLQAGQLDHGLALTGLADNDHPQYLLVADIDDTPVNGEVAQPISSNWAFDHVAAADPHPGYRLESADHNHQSTGLQGGQLDHGLALTGLADNDHPQYLLVADIDDTPVNGEVAQPISSNWAFDHVAAADPHTGYRLESVQIPLTTDVTGTLPEGNGGTGESTYTTGDILYAQGANNLGKRAIGSTGDVLTVSGGVPVWSAPVTGVTDHGALTGLGDDDHTQYALLAGRAGGQTLNGGTAAGDDLNLVSTTNGTKGNINIGSQSTYDEVNGRLGINEATPGSRLDVSDSVTSLTSLVRIRNKSTSATTNKRIAYEFRGTDTVGTEKQGPQIADQTTDNNYVSVGFDFICRDDDTLRSKVKIDPNGRLAVIGRDGTDVTAASVNAEFQGVDAVLVSKGTTAQRPTGVNGYIRQNTDINAPEFFDEAWTQFVGVLDRQGTQLDINTTNTIQTFYTFSVPANVMDTQKMLRLRLYGDYLNNSGSASTLTVTISFGGTTVYADASTAFTASATRHPFDFEILLANQNATNVQVLGGTLSMGTAAAAATGLGDLAAVIAAATGFSTPIFGTGARDTTAANTLLVQVTHSINNAATSIRRQFAILEVL